MKPFDLKEALSGKPVKLRNGQKALICYRIPDEYVFNNGSSAAFPLQGIIFNKRGNLQQIAEVWRDNGTYGDEYLIEEGGYVLRYEINGYRYDTFGQGRGTPTTDDSIPTHLHVAYIKD